MFLVAVQVSQGGRLVIPADIRQKMGLKVGDQVLLEWSDDRHELTITTRQQRLRNARQLVKKYAQTGSSVVDEFIQERRQAAADE